MLIRRTLQFRVLQKVYLFEGLVLNWTFVLSLQTGLSIVGQLAVSNYLKKIQELESGFEPQNLQIGIL